MCRKYVHAVSEVVGTTVVEHGRTAVLDEVAIVRVDAGGVEAGGLGGADASARADALTASRRSRCA